jgi:drug/metabolite transporter (DMT)-like permease
MIYLFLCIISSTLIFTVFKIAGKNKLDNYALITINYLVASALGFSLGGFPTDLHMAQGWYKMAIIIGILFILIFIVMAVTTQKSGMAVSTIASKMSVVVPITFSIIYFSERLTLFKIFAIILALTAVLLTIYKKQSASKWNSSTFLLPVILFLGSGTIDSMVKYSQEVYVGSNDSILFSSILFLIAAVSGIIILLFRGKRSSLILSPKLLITGFVLGIINFGSLYGLINALESNIFESSILFGINNIGIVMLSVIIAVIFFREKLLTINKIGIALSIIAIFLLSYV